MKPPKSRHYPGPDQQAVEQITSLIAGPYRRDHLIEYLHRIQDAHQQLSHAHLRALAGLVRLSAVEVFEVASFYHHFHITEQQQTNQITLRICNSISCAMQGAESLIEQIKPYIPESIRLEIVPCVGRCDAAPVAVLGQHTIELAHVESIKQAIEHQSIEAEIPEQAIVYRDYCDNGGYQCYQQCVGGQRNRKQVLEQLQHSGLRGLGGAGFPSGRKWQIVSEQPGEKYLIVNIDEGEPGTFKDRYYLETDPHRFIEGALIAAWYVGAKNIVIYLRDEYPAIYRLLQQELQQLNLNSATVLPLIELRRGAGAYICGEESALIESVEGKRGMPRLRPPYVAEKGVFNHPTLVHNLETLHWIRDILEQGGEQFCQPEHHDRKGMRSYSLSGDINTPGVYRAPVGITLNELVEQYGGGMTKGETLYGYFPGGASGGILPASLADVSLDFDVLQKYGCFIGSAAVIVFSTKHRARDLALNAMKFFAHESCGQCTPCRVGCDKAVTLMQSKDWDQPLLKELAQTMMDASICGLGQAAPNPMLCVMKYFPQEFM